MFLYFNGVYFMSYFKNSSIYYKLFFSLSFLIISNILVLAISIYYYSEMFDKIENITSNSVSKIIKTNEISFLTVKQFENHQLIKFDNHHYIT